jgi:hypothetical protein
MKIVIVADDKRVCVDGLCFDDLDMSSLDSSIHAIQWNGEWGEIEYKSEFQNGQITKPQNQVITDITPYQWAVNIWNVAKNAQAEEIAKSELNIPIIEA